jgi:hypothetical protein
MCVHEGNNKINPNKPHYITMAASAGKRTIEKKIAHASQNEKKIKRDWKEVIVKLDEWNDACKSYKRVKREVSEFIDTKIQEQNDRSEAQLKFLEKIEGTVLYKTISENMTDLFHTSFTIHTKHGDQQIANIWQYYWGGVKVVWGKFFDNYVSRDEITYHNFLGQPNDNNSWESFDEVVTYIEQYGKDESRQFDPGTSFDFDVLMESLEEIKGDNTPLNNKTFLAEIKKSQSPMYWPLALLASCDDCEFD